MGHSSIQVTVDTYCDLIGLAPDAGWVDHLNDLVPGATVAQPTQPEDLVESISHSKQSANSQKRKKSLKSLVSDEALDSKEDHDFSTSKSDKKRQKAQHGRNPDGDEL
jgi:hypothetical protein